MCRRFNSVPGHQQTTFRLRFIRMILKVAKLGGKTLRLKSREVDAHAVARGDYEAFLADLEETMREYEGTGTAAP